MKYEQKVGLYITVIIHLAVIIVFLIAQIGFSAQKEDSFVLDFTKQEELEKLQKELIFKEQINKRLESMLQEQSSHGMTMKNIAVNKAATLKDDRGTDADKLYEDARKLEQELKNGPKIPKESDDFAELGNEDKKDDKSEKKEKKEYSGPSIVSYDLGGRRATNLKIPAYRCYGGGEVTVIITVNRAGKVIMAKVLEDVSTNDNCLREFAVRAARMSTFEASTDAPAKQNGNIVYAFIAQ